MNNTAFQDRHLLHAVTFGGYFIMLCGCVASAGIDHLVTVEGYMDSSQYQQILENNVQESVTKLKLHQVWIFQQNNEYYYINTTDNLLRHSCIGDQVQHSRMAISIPKSEYY